MLRVRLVPVILIFLLSLGVLFGLWRAYEKFSLFGPMESELTQIPGVASVQVASGNPGSVKVQLKAVPDLQTTYRAVATAIGDTMGTGVQPVIVDRRDAELIAAYEEIQPVLATGIAKENYPQMISEATAVVTNRTPPTGIQIRITMDGQNIYVQLTKDSHYLYDVLRYTLRQGGATS